MQGFCWWEGLLAVVTLFVGDGFCQSSTDVSLVVSICTVDADEKMRSLCLGETKAKSLVQHSTTMRGLQFYHLRSLFCASGSSTCAAALTASRE